MSDNLDKAIPAAESKLKALEAARELKDKDYEHIITDAEKLVGLLKELIESKTSAGIHAAIQELHKSTPMIQEATKRLKQMTKDLQAQLKFQADIDEWLASEE